MSSDQQADIEELREEVVRLRAENARLRSRSGVAEPVQELTKVPTEKPAKTPTEKPAKAPVEKPAKEPVPRQLRRVLLLPDPSMPVEPGKLGPEVVANLARVVRDLLAEGEAAAGAKAGHHAAWAVLAVDLVLAELKLALTSFRTGRDGWRAVLETPRPEYDPPAQIAAEAPVGA